MPEEKKTPALVVRSLDDDSEVRRIPVSNASPQRVEIIMRGMLRNMDTDRFYVDDSEFAGGAP